MWPIALALLVLASPGSTPLGTARAYFEAIDRGDPEAALALVDEPSEADRLVVKASAASESSLRQLEELARSKFGDRGDLGVADRQRRMMSAIATAEVEVKGDRALIRPVGERPVRLKRVAGTWKVESPGDRLTRTERKALEGALRRTEEATKDLAERIRSGAFESAREARDALRRAFGGHENEGVPL
jgi:hypothetical protein